MTRNPEIYQLRHKATGLFLDKIGYKNAIGKSFSTLGNVRRCVAYRSRQHYNTLKIDEWEVVVYEERSAFDAVNLS